MAYWTPIRGISDPIPIRTFQGVYKPDDEGFGLSESLFVDLENMSPASFPALTTRLGYTQVGKFGTRVLGMGAWKDQELHVVFNDGTWRRLNSDGTWTQLATGLNTSAEWTFANFKGNLSGINLIGSNGVDPIKRYDGSTVSNLSGAPSGGNYICTQSNRLYCAVGNEIRFSALNKADDWTTVDDAGSIVHETNDGETIIGLNEGIGHVTVLKPSSIYELWGKGPTSYRLQPAATDIGVVADKAASIHDDIMPFISRDGIYLYQGGVRPEKRFSQAVQSFIRDSNKANLSKSVTASDGEHIYFGIPYKSTETDTILQYSPRYQAWYPWTGISPTHMIRIGQDLYIGDSTGRVLRLDGDKDNGANISWKAVTKPFTAATAARKQHWFKLYVVVDLPSGSTMRIYLSPSVRGNDWVLAKTLTTDADMQFKKILIPTNSIANANAVRIKLEGTGKVTIHEITRQLREMPMR